MPRMKLPHATADGLRSGLSAPLGELLDAWQQRAPSAQADSSTPPLLVAAFEQLFDVMARSESADAAGAGAAGVRPEAITEVGEYALELFDQALQWSNRLDLPEVFSAVQAHIIAMACWIAGRGGQLLSLEAVVDALARRANSTQDPGELLALYEAMSAVLQATAETIQQDLEKSNPGRPWRILHLNRAIVATRTHQPDLMEEAFADLTRRLPQDAAGFFSQGMEQMDLLNYPPHVRAVMDRYYRKWSVNRSLH